MRTLLNALRGFAALTVLVAVLFGVPWFLAVSLGIPWPRPVPTSLGEVGPWLVIWRIDRSKFVLDLLGIVGWLYWAAFVRQLVVQVPGAIADAFATARRVAPVMRERRPGPAASLVAVLLTALAVSVASGSRTPATAKAGQVGPAKPSISISASAVPAPPAATTPAAAPTHTVVDGDTLWDISTHHLGDAQRWHEIYKLNSGRLQADGLRLSDPNMILPGWILVLPTSAEAAVPVTKEAEQASPPASLLPITVPQPESTAVPSPISVAPVSTSSSINAHVDAAAQRPKAHRDRAFVELPDGGVVGIGLAAALAAAIALARKRRRIRTTARWPIPLDTPVPSPSAPVAAIERGHLATLAPPALGYFQDGDLDDDDPYLSALDGHVSTPIDDPRGRHQNSLSFRSGLAGPSIPPSFATFTAVGSLSFGTDGDREIGLDLRKHAGLGLVGPGAYDAARAIVVNLLANGGPLPSLDHMHVVMPVAEANLLLGGTIPAVPRLEVTANLDEALDLIEAEYLERRKVLADLGVRDAASIRRFYAEQTLEPIVLVATPESCSTPRLAALLDAGRTTDVHAVLLGEWGSGATVEIGAEGTSRSTDDDFNGLRAFTLSVSEAEALLAQLDPAVVAETGQRADEVDGLAGDEPADRPTTRLTAVPAPQAEVAQLPCLPRTAVNVLGPVTVTVDGQEVMLNNKETSILTFLALHSHGINRDEIIAMLWTNPDGTNNGSPETFRSTVYHARSRIRAATGDEKKMYIVNRGSRYQLDPADVTTDFAEFTKLLDTANRTRDESERVTALETAISTYRGHLAAGIYADWLIVEREAASRRFGDACARLADLTVDDRPEFALHVLERAVEDADCNQELYAKIMKVQAQLGRVAEMWKTLRLLEVRLGALDDEPDRDLYELADRLTSQRVDRAG